MFWILLIFGIPQVLAQFCEPQWTYFNKTDSCYKFFKSPISNISWFTAEEECNRNGGHLTTVRDRYESYFVQDLARTGIAGGIQKQVWIGIKRAEPNKGKWEWIDGTNVKYTMWARGEPNNRRSGEDRQGEDCVIMCADICLLSSGKYAYGTSVGVWNDQNCERLKTDRFVCRKNSSDVSFPSVNALAMGAPAMNMRNIIIFDNTNGEINLVSKLSRADVVHYFDK